MTTLANIYDQRVQDGAFTPDEDQRRALVQLEALRHGLEHPREKGFFDFLKKPVAAPKGFYFYGGVGRGKSMVMDLFFGAVRIDKKRRIHFHAFMLEVHDFLHTLRSRKEKSEQGRIDDDLFAVADKFAAEARLLCFDEFQVRDVADAMILGRLFTALFDRGVAVVMTSNICPDDLYMDGLQRDRFLPFIELLKERTTVFEFPGMADYRLRRLRGLQVYFWPHDADAHNEMNKIFTAVADEEAGAPVDITVKGRVIHVPKAARQVASFTFAELCEQPKSALDYLELVKRFHVFLVENVPPLNDNNRNATVRFITLVDTLYDHHARLVLSAAAPPERLYTGDDNKQVFERTVSRLMEMQSRDYRDAA
ncbi:MAG: cell division protein ZapE [Micavibrio sp.]|nr:cell division protein ZapE [Micavibrio sp.]